MSFHILESKYETVQYSTSVRVQYLKTCCSCLTVKIENIVSHCKL